MDLNGAFRDSELSDVLCNWVLQGLLVMILLFDLRGAHRVMRYIYWESYLVSL